MRIFYSNCIVEALKRKIKFGNRVKLIWIHPWQNDCRKWLPHVFWYNKNNGYIYDFCDINEPEHWWNYLWMQGYIRLMNVKGFSKWYNKRIAKTNKTWVRADF